MYVDLPSAAEVRSLVEMTGATCVSIYMPATPQSSDAAAERITFKNLASDAIAQLNAADADKGDVATFADVFAELDDDAFFWRYQANSLAVFATVAEVRAYRLASRLEPAVVVADRFFVKPLLRAVTFPNAGFVLALSQGSVRLLEFGADYGPIEVDVPDLPADLDEFMQTVPGAAGSAGFGVLSVEGSSSRLRKYARQVDRAVRDAVRGHDLPVILAAAEPLASVFRSVSTLSTLVSEQIPGSPAQVPDHSLAEAARGVLDGVYASQVRELGELFSVRVGQGRTATDLADVARAATFGAVDVLVVDIDRVVPGHVDDDGQVSFNDEPGAYGVVDEVARRVLATGGRVVAVRADEVPGGGEAAAILRYA
jgi:hypothetical protein